MRYAEALLGHPIPAEDLEEILDGAFLAYVAKLEKRKFAATSRPRRGAQRSSNDPRHIPAEVKRTVWVRDGGQCTFASDNGRRCPARTPLEYDHIEPVARGGQATAENIRLRCWAHNQYEAERTFGAGFMSQKREEAQRARARARAQAQPRAAAAEVDPEKDVVPWLRKLGFNAAEARLAAERCESIPEASLEDRLRFALSVLAPPHRVEYRPVMAT
jgi:5-methylcytosine-specific restriction endonuclease McrA